MNFIWDALSLLFFFCLFMLALSVFTERTAWFFKEKSRLRGAILWMSAALLCGVLVTECAPRPAPRSAAAERQAEAAGPRGPAGGLYESKYPYFIRALQT